MSPEGREGRRANTNLETDIAGIIGSIEDPMRFEEELMDRKFRKEDPVNMRGLVLAARNALKRIAEKGPAWTKETQSENHLSFAEANERLGGALEAAREAVVVQHAQWGLVDVLVEGEVISDASEYGALYDTAIISEAEVAERGEQLTTGTAIAVFNPFPVLAKKLKLSEGQILRRAVQMLVEEAGIGMANFGAYENLERFVNVDPRNIPNLKKLGAMNDEMGLSEHTDAFKKAAQNPLPPVEKPTISLMLDDLEVRYLNFSASQWMNAQVTEGVCFNNPVEYLLFMRTIYDRSLENNDDEDGSSLSEMSPEDYRYIISTAQIRESMPDRDYVTLFPNYVDPHTGDVLSVYFHPELNELYMCSTGPETRVNLGPRLSRGFSTLMVLRPDWPLL